LYRWPAPSRLLNPHLTLRAIWDDEEFVDVPATDPDWHKWRACDPTGAHWYGPEQFSRYVAAHVARDEDECRVGRTVRDFVSELRGLKRPGTQKLVLAETETSGMALRDFFAGGRISVASLLDSCQRHTKPVRPENLGLLGADHLLADCSALGAAAESFTYRKRLGMTIDGLPYALEVAFAWCPEGPNERRLITGINFSAAVGSPFDRVGYSFYGGLTSVLARQYVVSDDPVIVIVYYTCPRIEFADRGKGTLALPITVDAKSRSWSRRSPNSGRSSNSQNCVLPPPSISAGSGCSKNRPAPRRKSRLSRPEYWRKKFAMPPRELACRLMSSWCSAMGKILTAPGVIVARPSGLRGY
jgi:hypothetical protein